MHAERSGALPLGSNMTNKNAVVCAIIKGGKVLMVSRPENPNHYGIPGGKVEDNETPRDAAIREVAEETGIKLVPGTLNLILCKQVPSRREKDVIYTTFCYACNYDGDCRSYDSPEGLHLQWVPPYGLVRPPYAYYNSFVYQALCDSEMVERD